METPHALGAAVTVLDLRFADGWALDLDQLSDLVRPDVTKLVSLTYPHNPTGAMLSRVELEAVIALVEAAGAVLLFDETYRDLTVGPPLPVAASLSTRAISVCSLSKAYGVPGLRIGWAICADEGLNRTLLAAKEQMLICGSTIDEALAARLLAERHRLLPPIQEHVGHHRQLVLDWLADDNRFQAVEPGGGAVCFPHIEDAGEIDGDRFYATLNHDLGTYVGPGHWFDQDRCSFRLGFGWPSTDELERGLANLSTALDGAIAAGPRAAPSPRDR